MITINSSIALIFSIAFAGADGASGVEPDVTPEDSVVLSDGFNIDGLWMDANSNDSATSSRAIKTLEDIRKNNPTGKRHLACNGIGLDVPSWKWDYNRKAGIRGIEVDLNGNSDAIASVLVDYIPGLSDDVIGNLTNNLPDGAKVSKTAISRFGQLTGKGTRVVVLTTSPSAHRAECVLFYPKNKLEGCYICVVFSGPVAPNELEMEMTNIVQSIGKK